MIVRDSNLYGLNQTEDAPKCKCLIGVPLRSNVTWCSQADIKKVCSEPRHPFSSGHLAAMLADQGIEVRFINQVCSYPAGPRSKLKQVLDIVKYASQFDVVICYSTVGVCAAAVLSLMRWRRPRIVLYLQAALNPQCRWIKRLLLRRLFDRAVQGADATVSVLKELANQIRQKFPNKAEFVHYAPVGADTEFFDPLLTLEQSDSLLSYNLKKNEFLLVVGDITRDDEFIYSSLQSRSLQIVRVTRDPIVAQRAKLLINTYGKPNDVLLECVSFKDLRWLYANCSAAVFAGDDTWEPAGITSLTEALACGAICVCNAGGYIEKELCGLTEAGNLTQSVRFYERNNKLSLASNVQGILSTSPKQRAEISVRARDFIKVVCPVEHSYGVLQTAVCQALDCRGKPQKVLSRLTSLQEEV